MAVAGTCARVAVVAAIAALLCASAVVPGGAAHAADATPSPYGFDEDARSVEGATGTTDAERLDPGTTYRGSLPQGGKLYYRLELDAASNVYVSVTAVPRADSTVSASDGIRVSLEDADGRSCSLDTVGFGASRSPHPIAARGEREASANSTSCQGAGTYYVLVERVDRTGSSPDTWGLELAPFSEPRLKEAGATDAPENWNSASPQPLTGGARRREGGSGFAGATSIGQGVWRDDIRPGQTLFYKVPVDWGQQVYATVELGSSSNGTGYVSRALDMSLHNPVRAQVEDVGIGYDGRQRSAVLDPLPPVEYVNRYAIPRQVNGMRFAGSYYLVVHLAAQVAEQFGDGPLGLTLQVRVSGAAEAGPGYAASAEPPDTFEVTAQDQDVAVGGGSGGGDGAMTVVAVGGIGAGTVVLAVLGVWTVVARRRAAGA